MAQGKLVVIEPNYIYLAVLALVSAIGLGYFLLRKFLGNKVEGLYQKDILKFENDLTQHNELLKHELYKTAKNAELFIKMQHELYPQIYELLKIAHGTAYEMEQKGNQLASFDGFSEEEIKVAADKMHIPEDLKKEIKDELPNLNDAFKKYQEHLPMHLANKASEAARGAMNFWVTKELYFSRAANDLIRQIIVKTRGYVNKNKLRLNPHYSSLPREESDCLDEAQKLLDQLKERLFQEMKGL